MKYLDMRDLMFSLCAVLGVAAMAQTVTTGRFDFGYPDKAALSIPKEFSSDDSPRLVLHSNSGDECSLQIYDENIELVKTVNITNDKTFNYKLVYQDEVRDVTAVNEINRDSYCRFKSYDDFLQNEKYLDPSFNESQFIITEMENGDKKISVDYSDSQYSDNQSMYFAYDYFGMKYPKVYFVLSKSNNEVVGYRTCYSVAYSEWRAAGTHTEDCRAAQRCIRLCNVNLNQGDGAADTFFEVSQTLFNSDERYEYVVPKYKLVANGNVQGDSGLNFNDGEKIVTTRTTVISEDKELSLAGFQVVADNGAVIADLDFDTDDYYGSISTSYAYVITIGSSTYLAFNSSDSDHPQGSTIFFRINRRSGSIEKVKTLPAAMSVLPTVINQGSAIEIAFPDGNEHGSEIVVTSASGMRVCSRQVSAMQHSASIKLSAPSGIYFVSRMQNGIASDTKKIVLR